jgi:hypothetical protein
VEDPREREQRHARFLAALTRHDRARRRGDAWSRGWMSVAALVPILVWVFWAHSQSVITADELLQRIKASDQTNSMRHPGPVHVTFVPAGDGVPISVEFASRNDWRPLGTGSVPSSIAGAVSRSGFEWAELLRAQRVQVWRTALVDKREAVTDLRDQGLLVLRTSAPAGEPRLIELTVRRDTFDLVRELLMFGDMSRLELEFVSDRSSVSTSTHRTKSPAWPPSVSRPPGREELESAELRARLVLGESGLDMRGHIQVSVDEASVLVDGVISATASERRRARARLAEVPHVRVELRESGDHDLPISTGLSRWLERTYTDRAVRMRFVPELTGSISNIRQHLDVLAGLAERYRAGKPLPADGVATLTQLVNLHYRGLHDDLATLVEHVAVLCGTVPPPAAIRTPADWRVRVDRARSEAAELDRVVQALLAREDVSTPERQEVASILGQLWGTVQIGHTGGTH